MLLGVVLGLDPGGKIASAQAAAPANDDLATAELVNGNQFTLAADLAGATRESFEQVPASAFGQTLWWRWIAPDTGIWTWDTVGSSNAVAVTVLARDAFEQWNVVAETYLRPTPATEQFLGLPGIVPDSTGSFPVEAGETYWLRLDGVRSDGWLLLLVHDPLTPWPVSVSFEQLVEASPTNDGLGDRLHLETGGQFSGLLMAAT